AVRVARYARVDLAGHRRTATTRSENAAAAGERDLTVFAAYLDRVNVRDHCASHGGPGQIHAAHRALDSGIDRDGDSSRGPCRRRYRYRRGTDPPLGPRRTHQT